MSDLRITVGGGDGGSDGDAVELGANWTDEAPETRAALEAALPVEGDATRWGDELYFPVRLDVGPENARREVEEGAVVYWPSGSMLCLFWGPTPASKGEEPRAASPVNVVARVADVSPLSTVDGGAHVRVERGSSVTSID